MSEQRPIEDLYPLSPMQQGMLFHALYAPGTGVYMWQVSCLLRGPLDLPSFRRALARLIQRHAILRTSFVWEGLEQPLQMVEREVEPPLTEEDWSAGGEEDRRERLAAWLAADLARGFDLGQAPLTRLLIAREGEDLHRLIWSTHLLLVDGWSMSALIRELFILYEGFRAGQEPRLPQPRRYRDYIAWLQKQDAGKAEAFWRRELAGFTAPTPLPGLAPAAPGGREAAGPEDSEVQSFLPAPATAALHTLARRGLFTVNTVVQGAWALLLARGAGESDVVFGSTVSGRPPGLPGVESMIGLFINTLPVRAALDPRSPLLDFLKRLQERTSAARELEHTPLVSIQGWSEVPRGLPLFESILVFENYPVDASMGGGGGSLDVAEVRLVEITNYPLTLEITPGASLSLRIAYLPSRLEPAAAGRLLGQLETLLAEIGDNPDRALEDLPHLSAAERRQLLVEGHETLEVAEPLVHRWIGVWAERSPEAVAVDGEDGRLTFRELDERSNRLARHLQALGLGPESVAGILLPRSLDALVAQAAVLKAGGAFLPLDPVQPADRLAYFLAESGARILVTRGPLAAGLPETPARPLLLDAEAEAIARRSAVAPDAGAGPLNTAYTIFTSGSTGRPKGVLVPHRALASHATAMARLLELGPGDRVLQFASPGFDVALEEVFSAWCAGAAVVPAPERVLASPPELVRFAAAAGLTVVNLPAAYWHEWAFRLAQTGLPGSLRLVVTGSERVRPDALAAWRAAGGSQAGWMNAFGVTEATITSLVFAGTLTEGSAAVPVGHPVANVRAYLLDRGLNLAGIGSPGEIYLGGAGVARGYAGRPALTAERFLPDPYAGEPGARMYRTGDLARRRGDGAFEVLGRADRQVKIRGFRIELGEVEAALLRNPAIAEAVAGVIERPGAGARLTAWVVPAGPMPSESDVRRQLRRELPEAMIPADLVPVEALPLLPNGKIDLRALERHGAPAPASGSPAEPRGEAERAIAAVWREVLGREQVGLDDNFFDLGGHSLLLLQVQGKLKEALGREVALVDLFRLPTVRMLAGHLSPQEEETRALTPAASRRPAPQDDGRIAVIGMAGRFPGAPDVERFWDNLCGGVESIAFLTDEQLEAAGIDRATRSDPAYVRANGVLDGIELFDADFFGYTPREAEITDPQHRLFLECCWESLESAGYNPQGCPGRVGVYAGVSMSAYLRNLYSNPEVLQAVGPHRVAIGNDKDHITTTVSYKLNLKGPSLAVQTACSTSLVAVHLACRGLLAGECDMALAGGASISLPQHAGYLYQEGGVRSPDGHVRAFDARAQGMVAGSGVGVVALKRLADALADGDPVHAVILGSAVNNDGSLKVGYTAPSVEGQAEVIADALASGGIDPRTVGYVEAHGTGTPLGDPIEVAALARAFGPVEDERGFCALGSVKTNIGHLDAAAGVAGLIKAALVVERGLIPPSLHFETANPQIDFASSPFFVNAGLRPWNPGEGPRRAGVSSFGIGGTNAHAVLEAPPAAAEPGEARPGRPWQLLVLSGRTAHALDAAAGRLRDAFERQPDLDLADAAYTLQVGRRAWPHRRAVVCRDSQDALTSLAGRTERVCEGVAEAGEPETVFLFPGQGAQYPGMGLDLYRSEAVFREHLDHAAEILREPMGLDIRELLFPADSGTEEAALRLADTAVAQPALFAFEHALARLWMSWGVRPTAMIGHSLGEYVAACVAGVFSLEDGLRLVALRGRMIATLCEAPGAMASLPLAEAEAAALLTGDLALAAVNGPAQCVVSGPESQVDALLARLAAEGIEGRRLRTSHAFHSALMEPALPALTAAVADLRLAAPRIPYVSNLTGGWITAAEATDPGYWARHLRGTVRFADGLATLLGPGRVLLEAGPGQTLSTLARRHPRQAEARAVVASLGRPDQALDESELILSALGRLWTAGVPVDWAGFHAGERRLRVRLPTTPFERRRYWLEARPQEARALPPAPERRGPEDWFHVPFWKPAPLARRGETIPGEVWLLFQDACGLAGRVAERAAALGVTAVAVRPGEAFGQVGERLWTIDPRRREDYAALLSGVAAAHGAPSRALHLWGVTPPGDEDPAFLDQQQDLGFFSLLHLVQALGERSRSEPVEITVVTTGGQPVQSGLEAAPGKATVLGLSRVIPREFPHLSCRHVDLEPRAVAGPARLAGRLADDLIGEVLAPSRETTVAYRGGERRVQRFEPVRLEDGRGQLREGGVYLITGGFGGIGLELAEHLAAEARARLVLVGRSGLPPRDEWERLAEAGAALDTGIVEPAEIARLAPREAELRRELGVRGMAAYEGMERDLDAYCAARLFRFLAGSGVDVRRLASHRIGDLRGQLRVLPKFHKLLDFVLRTLAEEGWLRREGDEVVFTREPEEIPDPDDLAREATGRHPRLAPLIGLVDRFVARYGEALSGDVEAVGLLFAEEGPMREAEEVSAGFSYERVYTALAAEIAGRLAAKPGGRPLRILEFGAGQGRLTRQMVAALAGRQVEYVFTDLGRLFVTNAEREAAAAGLGFLRFSTLDISQDPAAQGFEPASFDLLLGLNVVHATRDVRASLSNLGRLLRPGGALCLLETVKRERWVDIVWGLAEGWWYFDDGLRRDSPLLTVDEWREALGLAGLRVAAALPEDAAARADSDFGLLLATRPGAVRANGMAGRVERVRRLEAMGSEVLAATADVADPAAMRRVADLAVERFGRIDGVIHAAGLPGGGIIELRDREGLEAELAAKVRGTAVLGELCREISPDFLMLCSSHNSFAGQFGQVGYCAANAFVDAYAHWYAATTGIRTLAVNWDRWQGVGMAIPVEEQHKALTGEDLVGGLDPAEGVKAFSRALASGLTQVVVSVEDFSSWLDRFNAVDLKTALDHLEKAPAAPAAHARPALRNEYEPPGDELEEKIVHLWEEIFGIERIGTRDDFFELGGDSLVAVQLISRLGKAFGVELRVKDLFENPTVAGLANRVEDAMLASSSSEELDRMLDEIRTTS